MSDPSTTQFPASEAKLQRLALVALALDNSALRLIRQAAHDRCFSAPQREALRRYYRSARASRQNIAAFADAIGLGKLARLMASLRLRKHLWRANATPSETIPFPNPTKATRAQIVLSRLDAFSLYRCQRTYAEMEREARRTAPPCGHSQVVLARRIETIAWAQAHERLSRGEEWRSEPPALGSEANRERAMPLS